MIYKIAVFPWNASIKERFKTSIYVTRKRIISLPDFRMFKSNRPEYLRTINGYYCR